MEHLAKQFIADSRAFFVSDYFQKIEACLHGLSDEDIWWRANDESNSIGNLLMHLEGSTRYWIITLAGESYSPRNRQQEFDQREHIPKGNLLTELKRTVDEVDRVLAGLEEKELIKKRQAASEEVTVLWALYHAVEHFAMHTGQIIMLAKMLSKEKIALSD